MDAFFASVEQRDNPAYQGKPLAVGYAGKRGVVAAASYEARKYGVFSAMPSSVALRKCPHLIFVPPRFEVYKQVSRQIRTILEEYTDLVEPLSLDEAYLDVTENKKNIPSATLIAREIKQRILEITQLTASAGISINKFLAKIASDYRKPNGLFLIPPEKAEEFVAGLPIEKFHGIGKVTAQKMQKLGVYKGEDLKKYTKPEMMRLFGKTGAYYFDLVRAIDEREVNPNRLRKSFGSETTFSEDLITLEDVKTALAKIAEGLLQAVQKRNFYGKTLTLKIKFADFTQITRSKTIAYPIDSLALMQRIYTDLLHTLDNTDFRIRLLGLSFSHLEDKQSQVGIQLTLF